MLINKYSHKISNSLLPIELINPYPSISNRIKWNKIDDAIKTVVFSKVRKYEHVEIQPLKGLFY